ncbi:MAG TPA: hypothetical protein ENK10_08720 [Acidobacteria bacterium]|nr:hypothetical protein [Acidobacteriota bacterium]
MLPSRPLRGHRPRRSTRIPEKQFGCDGLDASAVLDLELLEVAVATITTAHPAVGPHAGGDVGERVRHHDRPDAPARRSM